MAISTEVQNTTLPNPGPSREDWRKQSLKKVVKKLHRNDPIKIMSGQKIQVS